MLRLAQVVAAKGDNIKMRAEIVWNSGSRDQDIPLALGYVAGPPVKMLERWEEPVQSERRALVLREPQSERPWPRFRVDYWHPAIVNS